MRASPFAMVLVVGSNLVALGALAHGNGEPEGLWSLLPGSTGPGIRNLDSPPEMDAPPQTEPRWYGARIFLSDAVAFGGMFAAFVVSNERLRPPLALSGFAVYELGAPILHVVQGHAWKGAASFAMRLTPALAIATSSSRSCSDSTASSCEGPHYDQLAVGVLLMPAVAFLDAMFLANEDLPIKDRSSVRVEPWVDPGTRRVGAGLRGAF